MAEATRVLLHHNQTDKALSQLRARFPSVEAQVCPTYADLPGALSEFRPHVVYTVRFDGSRNYPRDALFGPGGPAWIANGGAGTDHFGHWDPARVTVTNAAGVAADMMAEYVMGGFLYFTLDIPGLVKDKGAAHWDAGRMVRPLQGKTLLIVGLGHTGRAIAARAKAFGMSVIGTRARPEAMDNVDEVHGAEALRSLLSRAHFIAVSTPLTASTRGLIGREEIAEIQPDAVLADVSRGGVVDQSALAEALAGRRLAGAALDVFETEPLPRESPLWGLPNVLISPHCSAVHAGWDEASFDLFLRNLALWEEGAPLFNIVEPSRGY